MVSEKIKVHLLKLVKTLGLKDAQESLEILISGFTEKLISYEKQVSEFNLLDVTEFNDGEDSGVLVITYSGSLLSIGPKINGKRTAQYISIGLRKDVPEIAAQEFSELDGNFKVDEVVKFIIGPIKSSSSIYKIAKVNNKLNALEQEELLGDVTKILIEDFVEVNNTVIV